MSEIGKEYGEALFLLAVESNEEKEYKTDVDFIRKAFKENDEIMEILRSPNIPFQQRLDIIDEIFAPLKNENAVNFLKLLCEKGRITELYVALDEFDNLLDMKKRIFTAKITSAVELSNEQKSRLIDKLKAKYKGEIKAEYIVNNQLIGGLIVEIDGEILDGSLSSRLKDLKEVMGNEH